MTAILLVRSLHKEAAYPWHLSNLLGFLRLNLFVKIDLWTGVNNPLFETKKEPYKQLLFFSG